ncbi:MAG: Sjogren's syndrome/scleroderma autoantigen 1 family protein [Candidatus Hadarchaeales archaeon]
MKDIKEEQVTKIAEFLLAGGKMLGIHCGKCGSPLFEKESKIVCPLCGEIAGRKEETAPKAMEKVKNVLEKKLVELAEELEKESDREKIMGILDRIKSILETLERLGR